MINDKLIPVNLEEEMRKSFISYAMAVIIDRALPDVRDGLKPVHRRIIYDMSEELGMTPDKPYRKSARLVGDVLGKFHPHGDSSVYDAMVRLAQPFNIRYPLVDGQGNYGSVDGDGAAAMRYTEARMTKLATCLMEGIDKDTVDFYPNFDETLQQPAVLPSRFPNLLVNGSSGIAVGMATNIPPHNLRETINGVICMIEKPDCTIDDLMQHIKGPDFPTGGLILGRSGIREAYFTGHGKITVRARTNVEEMSNGRSRIIVTELPYQVNKAKTVEKIADLVHDKVIEGISDIRDESNDRDGMRIVIELKKDAYPQVVLNLLFKHTSLQENFGANMLALVNGKPRVLNLREMVYYYLEHQKDVVTRRTRFELDKAQARAHILEGLLKALDHIDEIVALIRANRDTASAREALMERFGFSEKQAQAILDMRLARLTGLERDKLQAEYDELLNTIAYLTSLLADQDKLMGVIRDELTEIRDKYADERRTELTIVDGEIDVEDLIAEEDMVVTMTHEGYLKRVNKSTYRAQNRGGKGVSGMSTKDEDYAVMMRIVNTHDEIMFFTNQGRVYSIKCYQIPEAGRTARGTAAVNLLQIAAGEKIQAMLPVPRDIGDHNIVMATKNGIIKKTAYSEFANLRKKGLIALNFRDEGDELIGAAVTSGTDKMLIGSRKGKALLFDEQHVRCMGRTAAGVKAMTLAEDDQVIDMDIVQPDTEVLCVTTNGMGKRTPIDQYTEHGRGGQGMKAMNLNEKTGDLAAQMMVHESEDVLLITDEGTIVRTPASGIRSCGRATSGTILMRLNEGAHVVGVCRAEPEDAEPENTSAGVTEAPVSEGSQVIDEASSEMDNSDI